VAFATTPSPDWLAACWFSKIWVAVLAPMASS
jgi:hypothetical protein